jgi:hypothetical protein
MCEISFAKVFSFPHRLQYDVSNKDILSLVPVFGNKNQDFFLLELTHRGKKRASEFNYDLNIKLRVEFLFTNNTLI